MHKTNGGDKHAISQILLFLVTLSLCISSCSSDGKLMGEGKDFDLGKTILAIGGTAAAVVGAAACAENTGCMSGLADGMSGYSPNTSLTGGPYWDWDQFSNGQFRCRDIDNGEFARNSLCAGMPKDDDRWPTR